MERVDDGRRAWIGVIDPYALWARLCIQMAAGVPIGIAAVTMVCQVALSTISLCREEGRSS